MKLHELPRQPGVRFKRTDSIRVLGWQETEKYPFLMLVNHTGVQAAVLWADDVSSDKWEVLSNER